MLVLPLIASLALGQVYRWVDKSGEQHFTDDRSTIPKGAKVMPFEPQEPNVSIGNLRDDEPVAAKATRPAQLDESKRIERPETKTSEAATIVLDTLPRSLKPGDAEILLSAVQQAIESPKLRVLGGLRQTVHVAIIENKDDPKLRHVASLAVGFAGSATQVYLLSPYIGVVGYGRPRPWAEIALHEVAHAQMFQFTGAKRVPRWFTEGYAMYVANEEGYASKEDVAYWALEKGGGEPLANSFSPKATATETFQHYALALEALRLMVGTRGESGVAALLQEMREGADFDTAFKKAMGQSVRELEAVLLTRLKPYFHSRAQ